MIIIAASLYLPEHVANIASRAWFYYAGDETATASSKTSIGKGFGVEDRRRMDSGDVINMLGRL